MRSGLRMSMCVSRGVPCSSNIYDLSCCSMPKQAQGALLGCAGAMCVKQGVKNFKLIQRAPSHSNTPQQHDEHTSSKYRNSENRLVINILSFLLHSRLSLEPSSRTLRSSLGAVRS